MMAGGANVRKALAALDRAAIAISRAHACLQPQSENAGPAAASDLARSG